MLSQRKNEKLMLQHSKNSSFAIKHKASYYRYKNWLTKNDVSHENALSFGYTFGQVH